MRKLFQSEGLFADHYLKGRLSQNDWWPTDEVTRPVWEFCRDLYNKRFLALAKNNEAFTRQELIDPVLEKLGFAWTDNLGLPDQDAEPDYIVFANRADKETVLAQDTASRYRAAAGILEVKKLNHPLSQVSKHQQRYPHQQIRDYLLDAQVLSWGILANGNEWRLYCREAKRHEFFAINFEVAIQSLENFKFFLALFSPAAFQRDIRGKCRLDFVREQSLSAQSRLEEDLRQRVFTILTDLANGFAARPENRIADTPESRTALYENCLIYLYRLLFLLYAEGRGLLPVEPRTRRYYKELSLERLKPDLKNFAAYDSQTRTRLGEDVGELFRLVNGTDEAKNKEYGVARYNGGLFDPANHPLLEHWRIADADLAGVLRGLMFDPPPKPNEPALPIQTVDFGDLRVQQLGSIYEGLLEHHLARNAAGRLELQTDKAERKATGTYYTPDYIVKYIVEQTLTPLLDEIEQGEIVRAARAAKLQDNSFAEAALVLNVCDPAMGSGHFLVEATTFLADHIAAHPTTRRLHDKSKDAEELAHWRRRVVEACIYGVDLNPLAVELAKLSLWLTCIASDQPLNFLDHHLRCGNSLLGARLDQLGGLPDKKAKRGANAKQLGFSFGPDFKRAVADTIGAIKAIEGEASGDVDKVKIKERRWAAEILPRLAPYKRVADLWTGTFFGGTLDEEGYVAQARQILAPAAEAKPGRAARTPTNPAAAGSTHPPHPRRFFHWELEFPDVFHADDGSPKANPGFDAVIGNPPYVRIQGFPRLEIDYLTANFATATGNVDLYVSFIERGVKLCRPGGRLGEIVPNKFFKTDYGEALRGLVAERGLVSRIVDFGSHQVFGATTYTCLLFLTNQLQKTFLFAEVEAHARALAVAGFKTIRQDRLSSSIWMFGSDAATSLQDKLQGQSVRLLDLPAAMSRGSSSGDDEVFVVEDEVVEDGICRAPLFATDFGRYSFAPEGRWKVIYPYVKREGGFELLGEAEFLKRFPKAYHYLETKRSQLAKRKQFAAWYGYSAPRNLGLHDRAEILVPLLANRGVFALVPAEAAGKLCPMASGGFTVAIADSSPISPAFVLSVVNSTLLFWRLSTLSNVFRGGWLTCTKQYFGELPIRRIAFTTPAAKRAVLAAQAKKLYANAVAAGDPGGVLAFADEQLRAQPERSDVLHDLLAFLASRMMELNRERRAASRQFLTDLLDFHGIDARKLNPKTRLNEFWKLQTAEVFAHFRNNSKLLAAAKLNFDESAENKIRARFEKSKATILPLESQIAFTDRLIDQLVYRLYGLTEAEVQLVEAAVATKSPPAPQPILALAPVAQPARARRKKSAFADPPRPPLQPGITPEQAYSDAAHFFSVKEDPVPYGTKPADEP